MNAWVLQGNMSGRRVILLSVDSDGFTGIGTRRGRKIRGSLGLIHIASELEKNGWSFQAARTCKVSDLDFLGADVGFSVQLDNYLATIEASRVTREQGARTTTFGGPYPSVRSGQIMATRKCVDYVIAGQGELAYLDILNDQVSPRTTIQCHAGMEQLGPRNRTLWPPESVLFDNKPLALVYWAEGCPIALKEPCLFCSIGHVPQASRRDVAQIIKEMEDLRDLGFGSIEIGSDDFPGTVPIDWLRTLAIEIKNKGLEFSIFTHAGVRSLRGERLDLLKRIGVSVIQTGFESANPALKVLGAAGKASRNEEEELTRRCHEASIKLQVSFIVGFPSESEETMEETLAYAMSLAEQDILSGIQIDPFIPLPGSRAFEQVSQIVPSWAEIDYVQPLNAVEVWFQNMTKLHLDHFLQRREELLQTLPSNIMIAGMLLN